MPYMYLKDNIHNNHPILHIRTCKIPLLCCFRFPNYHVLFRNSLYLILLKHLENAFVKFAYGHRPTFIMKTNNTN